MSEIPKVNQGLVVPENGIWQRPISRRTAVRAGAAAAGAFSIASAVEGVRVLKPTAARYAEAAGCEWVRATHDGHPGRAFEKLREGFSGISRDEHAEIFGSAFSVPMEFDVLDRFESGERMFAGTFSLDKPEIVTLDVYGKNDENVSAAVVEVRLNGELFYAPILQTWENNMTTVALHGLNEGANELEVSATSASRDLTGQNMDLQLHTIRTADPLHNTLLRLMPKLYIRGDNVNRLTNDLPTNAFGQVMRHDTEKDLYLVEEGGEHTSQTDGTSMCLVFDRNLEDQRIRDRERRTLLWATRGGEIWKIMIQARDHDYEAIEEYDAPVEVEHDKRVEIQLVDEEGDRNNITQQQIETDHAFSFMTDYTQGPTATKAHISLATEILGTRKKLREGKLRNYMFYIDRLARQVGAARGKEYIDLVTDFTNY